MRNSEDLTLQELKDLDVEELMTNIEVQDDRLARIYWKYIFFPVATVLLVTLLALNLYTDVTGNKVEPPQFPQFLRLS